MKFQLKGKETVDEVKELLQKDSTGEVFGLSVIDPVCGRSRCKVTEEIDEMTKEKNFVLRSETSVQRKP
ncbi:hypothetical protein [Coprococcus sp. AF21-14LB]|uniref:hypothetical protein n=1 Tax=Coprococcus sp. AF21-14LB TaxID=2292231 RepID=UPI000E493B26|nr:hypothetical protein [Coprococcus sp. AF21-14LB]